MKAKYILVLITSQRKEADKIANYLIENKLCACINIVKNIDSIYWWQGKIVKDKESLLLCKTKKELFKKLETEVKKIHSYSVPEIIAFEIKEGNKDYLNWIQESLKGRF